MKKTLVLILIALMFLGGCSADPYAEVSNSDEAVITVDGVDYTRGQFYDAMISSDSTTLITAKLVSMIYATEIGDDADIIAQADTALANFKTAAGDYLSVYLSYYGYANITAYYKDMILYLKQDALVRKYIEDNFDALVTKYQPKMVKMLQTSSQADAEAALAEIKAGADFAETTTKYGNGNYTGAEQLVYNTSTDVNSAVLTAINSYTAAGLMDAVVVNDEGTLYNVIEITSVDATAFKDTFIDTFASDDTMNSTALAYYVRKGNFTVYDEDVYNALSDSNPEYLDQ